MTTPRLSAALRHVRNIRAVHHVRRGWAWLGGFVRAYWSQRSQRMLVRMAKAALAAVLAWEVSGRLFDLPSASLAPWAALLTAQVTVYRSVRSSLEQTAATVLGVLLAFAGAHVLGVSSLTLGLALLISLLIGQTRLFSEQQTTPAVSALFVLTLGFVDDQRLLVLRVGDVLVGVLAGIAVNLVLVPPLTSGDAVKAVAEGRQWIADLLRKIALGVRQGQENWHADQWLDEAIRIDDQIKDLWPTVRLSQESLWWNPRRRFRTALPTQPMRHELSALEQTAAETRSLVRALWGVPAGAWSTPHPGPAAKLADGIDLLARIAEEDNAARKVSVRELDRILAALQEDPGLARPEVFSIIASIYNAAAELTGSGPDDRPASWSAG